MHKKAQKQACEHKHTISEWIQGHTSHKLNSGTAASVIFKCTCVLLCALKTQSFLEHKRVEEKQTVKKSLWKRNPWGSATPTLMPTASRYQQQPLATTNSAMWLGLHFALACCFTCKLNSSIVQSITGWCWNRFLQTSIWRNNWHLYFIYIFTGWKLLLSFASTRYPGGGLSLVSSAKTTSGILQTPLGEKKKKKG